MDVVAMSQKQKMILFLGVLCIGFICLAGYTTVSLNSVNELYKKNNQVTIGAEQITATEVELLKLAASLSAVTSSDVNKVENRVEAISKGAEEDALFLRTLMLKNGASELEQSVQSYQNALLPWLSMRGELGFNADDGMQGKLKLLASVIEEKIKETGMVSLNSDFQAMVKAEQNYRLSPNEQNLKLFNRAKLSFVNISNSYAMLELYEEEIASFSDTVERMEAILAKIDDVESALVSSQEAVLKNISDIAEQLSGIVANNQQMAQDALDSAKWSVLAACLALAALTITIFGYIGLSMRRSLGQTSEVLDRMSSGNLSSRLTVGKNSKDEFNHLAMAINHTSENLSDLIKEVQSRSDALSDNAQALNNGLDSMASSQSEITNQTQIIAATTEEVNVTAEQVSGSLDLVAEVSHSSMLSAEEGGKTITLAIGSLEEVSSILNSAAGHIQQLEEASQKVDSVMEIITGIAEQTNLLALNAAIEAARAGEQGRGFAVVADEVRSLAVRTVEAVDEISGTIETMKHESGEVIQYISSSKESVEQGKQRGEDAITALNEITTKASEANKQTNVIASSINELVKASQSMTENMAQISQAMAELENNSERLRESSQIVDVSSSSLTEDCRRFTV
ncbi:methyl-accepting chemotaxis protein [Vibrio hannami]|uniref:methyl-accepting chemotaxis protein n=1 Tax=Vibrio hannami TaxID=2717094 RepID=UPI00240ED5A9|nr:methyl-accepting chemotaxis protein [Vibrio hannami]MDG3088389.1 methyl-accepting chemotaxis protein [Vibrio hannami]